MTYVACKHQETLQTGAHKKDHDWVRRGIAMPSQASHSDIKMLEKSKY